MKKERRSSNKVATMINKPIVRKDSREANKHDNSGTNAEECMRKNTLAVCLGEVLPVARFGVALVACAVPRPLRFWVRDHA
eukprot:2725438-Amphidinium_carterae.1